MLDTFRDSSDMCYNLLKKKLKDRKNNAELEDVSISKFENTKKNMKNLVPIEN